MRLGDLYAKQSLVAEAKGCYAFAVAEYTRLGKSQDATQVLQKVARIDPNDLKVVICLAEVYARRGDSELAGECYVSVARALVAKGYSKEASQLLQKAVRSGINSEALRNELARHADPGATRGPTKS
jgi:Flp pilus assembly protein TadD